MYLGWLMRRRPDPLACSCGPPRRAIEAKSAVGTCLYTSKTSAKLSLICYVRYTGSDQKIVFNPLPQDDPMQRQPDITVARQVLGWEPKVERAEGMEETYAYFKGLTKEELYRSEHKDFSAHNRH